MTNNTQNHTNHVGATSFRRNLKEQVVQVLTTNTLSDTYYVRQNQLTDETLEVVRQMCSVDPIFLAKAIVYARNCGYLQLVNITALAVLSQAMDKRPFQWAFPQVIQTPDNLSEFVSICRSKRIRAGLGGVALKMTKEWLGSLSEYHSLKYSGDSRGVSLRDCLRMAHPKPADQAAEERFRWLVKRGDVCLNPRIAELEKLKHLKKETDIIGVIRNGGLPWEVVIPAVPSMTLGVWLELMQQMPYMALLRHLNALKRAGVFQFEEKERYVADRLTDTVAIAKAKILPFRLFEAWKAFSATFDASRIVVSALEQAMEASFINMPELKGSVAIGSDVSGSMSSWVSPKGQTRYIDICGIFTAALLKKAQERVIVLPFDWEIVEDLRIMREDSMMTTINKLASVGGGGTAVGAPIQYLLDRQIVVDTFIGITDNEDWCYGQNECHVRGSFLDLWREYRKRVAPNANAYLLTIDPCRCSVAPDTEPGIHFIYGWSPDVPRYIASAQSGQNQLDKVHQINYSPAQG